jgi:hypothetical protein
VRFALSTHGFDFVGVVCKHECVTTIVSVRVERDLARRAEQAAQGNLSSFVREAIEEKVKAVEGANGNKVVAHIQARAGSWDGFKSGVELLKWTRP